MAVPELLAGRREGARGMHGGVLAPAVLDLVSRGGTGGLQPGHARLWLAVLSLPGLPAAAGPAALLDALRDKPALVEGLRKQRALIDAAAADTAVWRVLERNPALALYANVRAEKRRPGTGTAAALAAPISDSIPTRPGGCGGPCWRGASEGSWTGSPVFRTRFLN